MSAPCLPSVSTALLLGLSACTVYTPMQPHAPLIRARGEGEVALHLQGSLRPELHAAYSPLNHLLVLAGGTWRPSLPTGPDDKQDHYRTRQYEIGLGTYWPLGAHWTATATGGVGAAYVQQTVTEFGLILAFSNDYEARYRKNFGQLGFSYQSEHAAVGFTYRLTQVSFQSLTATDRVAPYTVYELPLDDQFRHEPYFFARLSLAGPMAQSRWQVQAGGGLSFCVPGRSGPVVPFDAILFRAKFNRGTVLLANVGIVYCLKRAAPVVPR